MQRVLAIDDARAHAYYVSVQEFEREVLARLGEIDRTQAWLARRIGRSPSALHNYLTGRRPWPREVRLMVATLLDIKSDRTIVAAEVAA